jgi:hypothetical protein
VKERTYRIAGELEKEMFEQDPMSFIWEGYQRPPQPHIMFVGPQGSGLHTQLNMVSDKYKLETFNILEAFLQRLTDEKTKRKRSRLLARGFKEPEPTDGDEEDAEEAKDPEIENDPDEFEVEPHEREVLRAILDASKGQLYNGNWFALPDEEAEIQITSPFIDMMFDSRRPPEVVINIKVSEKEMMERLLDKDEIQGRFDKLMEELTAKRAEERAAAEKEKIEELKADEEMTDEAFEEQMKAWNDEQDEAAKALLEDDPDAPVLETMMEEEVTKLKERRE